MHFCSGPPTHFLTGVEAKHSHNISVQELACLAQVPDARVL